MARRDKYESDVKEYWVDIHTEGNTEHEREESFQDKTFVEGQAENFELGLVDGPLDVRGDFAESEKESDDDMEDDAASTRSKQPPGIQFDPEKESALEVRAFS